MTTISKILIANRGEIARRIARTCDTMGIDSVAVFSDADADAPHVRAMTEAVRIGPAESSASYLNADKLIDAAKKTGADAVHPGYGFLAENAAFAEACAAAGLTFIGPTPEAIRSMGSKKAAKALAEAAGVPVIDGWALDDPNVEYPVLIKASAGGGGKGMRIARNADELATGIESARREALGAFGDDTLLLERYIDDPRHIEIQILGDTHGNLVHVFERECSIQRRHQKIIEETPSVAVDDELRQKMGDAAIAVAKAIGYVNAGTVELILAPDGRFFFLEVNTRLQVEHPVTEMVSGLDLVAEQIRIAEGHPLRFTQEELRQDGAAIEVRVYAEDPNNGFLPATGKILDWHVPDGVRVDTGVESGSDVGIHYDPMLAKIIAHGANRDEAIRKLRTALKRSSIQGVTTNVRLLIDVLSHPAFIAGETDTHFLDKHAESLRPRGHPGRDRLCAVAATLARRARRTSQSTLQIASGWRNNRSQDQSATYRIGEYEVVVRYRTVDDTTVRIEVAGDIAGHIAEARDVVWAAPTLSFELDGVRRHVRLIEHGDRVFCHSVLGDVVLDEVPRFPQVDAGAVEGGCIAPMPGKVVAVNVVEGDEVVQGQVLVVLEAMKMEHAVQAPSDGVVERVLVSQGEQVEADAVLVVLQ